jgi:glycosyltransferase involved in cell wall biosynthesis
MSQVLLIAFHFPPLAGSSGIQRTLRFAQELPAYGWQPLVLSAHPLAYERVSDDLLAEVPPGMMVRRAFAVDTARQLSVGGRYLSWLARPDRWMSWRIDAVRQGMGMIREHRPRAIWSTYPIATAHAIGAALHQRTGLPWLADFRDPMAQDNYPADPKTRRAFVRIEELAFAHASRCIFTTPSAKRMYEQRYAASAAKCELIENGYDEGSFEAAERAPFKRAPLAAGAVTLLHSGIVYPSERDPTHLLDALRLLAADRTIEAGRFRIRFRAPVHDALLLDLASARGVTDLIEVLPPIDYTAALREMLCADGLLVMQASNCNEQVPAKIYEYLRAKHPILCLSDPAGDTDAVLRDAGVTHFARLDSAPDIAKTLRAWLGEVRAGVEHLPDAEAVTGASRRGRAAQLASLLDAVAAPA